MKIKMPTLSEATKVVCRRRYSDSKSIDNFVIAMNHNIKAIGDLPVNKITRPMVNQMMDKLQQEFKNSNAVVNRKMGYLKVVLQEMEEDGFIEMIKFPKRRPTKNSKVHYLTDDMEKELLTWLERGKDYKPDYTKFENVSKKLSNKLIKIASNNLQVIKEQLEARDIIICLIDLGCRVNELLGLEKRFVDFDNNQINFNDRKNDQAVAVPMTDRVRLIIKKYYDNCKEFDKLFSLNYSRMNGFWQAARESLGYADKKFYTLHLCRHTCASRLVQRGVPILLVKDWLGHEDIENTMIYAHLQPKALHSYVEVLN